MKDETPALSRRQVVAGGSVLAVSVPVEGRAAQSPPTPAAALENPSDKYPKPPFKVQSQEWPGLASKMDPVPIMARKAIAARAGL